MALVGCRNSIGHTGNCEDVQALLVLRVPEEDCDEILGLAELVLELVRVARGVREVGRAAERGWVFAKP